MDWNYVRKKPRHWNSILPDGYFIVMEDADDGGQMYAFYEGDYDDWFLMTGEPLSKKGDYETLKEAKAAAEALETG
jgi:hypothetical protein